MIEKYIEILFPFLKKAGKLALAKQKLITGCEKSDGSIVTETDLKISSMFSSLIKKHFSGHYVFYYEKALKEKKLRDKVAKSEFLWTIDPIDGTKAYFHGSSLFGLAIGLYKNLKPVFGVIYLPAYNQILYNDEKNAYHITNAFKRNETKIPIYFQKKELNKNSLVYFPVKSAAKYIKDYKFTFIDGYSAYIYAFDTLVNISQGAFLKENISMWDIYATLPIANILGIKIYNINNGAELTRLDFDLFKEDFKAKNIWLICHPCYRDEMLSILYEKERF